MNEPATTLTARDRSFPTILVSAVLQGGALYALHHAFENHHWPTPGIPLTLGLYTCAVLVPLTVQLLAEYAQRRLFWSFLTVLTGILFCFGWYFGSSAVALPRSPGIINTSASSLYVFALQLLILWLLGLPFLQSRLATGHWGVNYHALFTFGWRNKIVLLEAAVFTGLFWLLLELWQMLFHMLDINFFRTLFQEPLFVYPVTAVVFGIALHLVGGIESLVTAVLEHILNVLKWLAVVAGVLLTLFTLALLLKLPGLVFAGQRAIGAKWLLWLIAAMVLFLNAAYRDGSIAQPYPRWIGQALRFVVPLTVVIALTASYSLLIREHHYGLTVERYWAFVVAVAGLLYAIGYSVAVFNKGAWLAGMAQVNVGVARALIGAIAVALTPLASPYRLAADSQYLRILHNSDNLADYEQPSPTALPRESAFQYLRWDTGNYGRMRLQQLSKLEDNPQAERIRRLALSALQAQNPWQPLSGPDTRSILAALTVYPSGRTVDAELAATISKDMENRLYELTTLRGTGHNPAGLYVDLNGDGSDEFVIFGCCSGEAYQHRAQGWSLIGSVRAADLMQPVSPWMIESELGNQHVDIVPPQWQNLVIGNRTFLIDISR